MCQPGPPPAPAPSPVIPPFLIAASPGAARAGSGRRAWQTHDRLGPHTTSRPPTGSLPPAADLLAGSSTKPG